MLEPAYPLAFSLWSGARLALEDLPPRKEKKPGKGGAVEAATPAKTDKDAKQEIQGVFVLTGKGNQRKVEFKKVETGITGTTDVEVVSGLNENDEIVTGSYKVLRTLKNGASVST